MLKLLVNDFWQNGHKSKILKLKFWEKAFIKKY